jgi:hypothetical protein
MDVSDGLAAVPTGFQRAVERTHGNGDPTWVTVAPYAATCTALTRWSGRGPFQSSASLSAWVFWIILRWRRRSAYRSARDRGNFTPVDVRAVAATDERVEPFMI